jgi:hypothetical protein
MKSKGTRLRTIARIAGIAQNAKNAPKLFLYKLNESLSVAPISNFGYCATGGGTGGGMGAP